MTVARRLLPFAMVSACFACVLAVSAQDQKPQHSAVKPNERKDQGAVKLHQSFVERAKKGDVQVLFLGDSITQGWGNSDPWKKLSAHYKTANFGIGGDRTQHILWRITEGKELEGIDPQAIVLMIGTNNMGDNSAAEIADGVTAIVKELNRQKPKAKVLLFGIFPRSAKADDKVRAKIKDCNKQIAKLDDGKQVRYLDIGDQFLDPDGNLPKEIMPDYLHLSPKGYEIWAKAIEDELPKLLDKKQ
jgi:lysophospholipase L1-like esterase